MTFAKRMTRGSLLFQSRLTQNAIQGAWGEVVVGFTRNGHATGFCGMLVLPMAPLHARQMPTMLTQQDQHIAHFHCSTIPGSVGVGM